MEVFGYAGALIIGLVMGLLGGGGSVLGVPILVYLLLVNPVTATAYSLFIVGTTALFGLLGKIKQGLVNYKIGLIFGLPSLIMVYITRRFILPMIPEHIMTIGEFQLSKSIFIMVLFAFMMIAAAVLMIKGRKEVKSVAKDMNIKTMLIIGLDGMIVGFLTGLVGAGGGFLIIPALVILFGLDMKIAVGTSLFIITMKSLVGFIGDMQTDIVIDWKLLLTFTFISIIGIFIGNYLTRFISSNKLKKAFGFFVLAIAIFIIIKEIL